MTTQDLICAVKKGNGSIIEATLLLNAGGRATHFIYLNGDKIVDDGVEEGSEYLVSFEAFEEFYESANWVIDQVVVDFGSFRLINREYCTCFILDIVIQDFHEI